jgi:hypothetical protein
MTAHDLFRALGPLVAPALEQIFDRRDLCILATRVAIETARYFGIQAVPLPVKLIAYNADFARHVAAKFADVEDRTKPQTWGDSSWSVGIGYGKPYEPGKWDGHLIAVGTGCFADFSIQQAERPQYNIITGKALVGPWHGEQMWKAENETGTVIEYYRLMNTGAWRNAPDWRDEKRRRKVVGQLIRAVRERETIER